MAHFTGLDWRKIFLNEKLKNKMVGYRLPAKTHGTTVIPDFFIPLAWAKIDFSYF